MNPSVARGHVAALALMLSVPLAIGAVACRDTPAEKAPEAAPTATDDGPPPTRPAVADPDDWCPPHDVPESMCTKCHRKLIARYKAVGDYCEEHRFPESVCPKCNPLPPPPGFEDGGDHDDHEGHGDHDDHDHGAHAAPAAGDGPPPKRPAVADAADWCGGHAVPESMCTKCHGALIARYKAVGDYCEAHGFPESVCPKCHPLAPPGAAPDGHEHGADDDEHGAHDPAPTPERVAEARPLPAGTVVRMRDPAIEEAAGIAWVPAAEAAIADAITAPARIDFDRNHLAEIRAPIPGLVREVLVDEGATVTADAPLFSLESVAIGDLQARRDSARARLRVARTDLERQRRLASEGIASERDREVAANERAAAAAEVAAIDRALSLSGAEPDSAGRFPVTTPIAGVVVTRDAVLGGHAAPDDLLAVVADPTRMWALLDVNEWDAASVRPGQRVDVTVDGVAGRTFSGEIVRVGAAVDPRARTVQVRVALANPDGLLRAHQFGRAVLDVRPAAAGVAVPHEAVQRHDDRAVVFVRTAPGVYEPRAVTLGRADAHRVQVTGPVRTGDAVVTDGAFLLRTELDRDSIGAGCCEVERPGGS